MSEKEKSYESKTSEGVLKRIAKLIGDIIMLPFRPPKQ